jgi:hypothetical protein
MALVIDTVTWALYEARLRDWLGVPTGHDDDLESLLYVSTGAADHWMANPFEDDDGVNTLTGTTLSRVVKGVLDFAYTAWYSSGDEAPKPGLTSVKTGDFSAGYAGSKVTKVDPTEAALNAAKLSWYPFRKAVWR